MKKIILTTFVFFFIFQAFAQENPVLTKEKLGNGKPVPSNIWRQVKISENFYQRNNKGAYMIALKGYLAAYDYNSGYPELNYKLGICYLNSVYKAKSLFFLKKAYRQKPDISKDILFQLAKAYQYNYSFDSAIFYFNEYKKNLKDYELKKIGKTIDKKINECKLSEKYVANPVNVKITDISEINSEYPEYCPVITADQSKMYFTARKPDCTGGSVDPNDGQYYEDIYVSKFKNNKWSEPQNVGTPLNTRSHDATVALAPDGQSMLLYRNGDLYICYKRGEKWSFPVPLPKNINTKAIENSACFSFDGKTIYFVRGKTADPKTSNGDIYVTKLVDGKWTDPQRLPDIINTPEDEDGVFIHPDGRTLYFSSKGHETMGGFDIFKSTKDENGNWTKPINLGYPINTPDDDVYFVMSADGKTAYYSSVRKNSEGFSDIYKIEFIPKTDSLTVKNDTIVDTNTIQKVYLTLITGKVYDANTLSPLNAVINIFDNANDSLILTTNTDPSEGTYIITLPSGVNYGMSVKSDGYLFYSDNFNVPKKEGFNHIVLDIPLNKIQEGSKVVLKNIFFDFDKATLRKESEPELMRVVNFLKENPDVKIEISGHTDNKGSHEYNKQLSENRAKSVVQFLIEHGIDKSRLSYRGASYDEPIASNDTEEGRQLNRRVEFKIISVK